MKDVIFGPQGRSYERPSSPMFGAIPASSIPRVPQSSVREGTTARNPLFGGVQKTPTRTLSRTRAFLAIDRTTEPVIPPSSPLHMRRSSAQLFATILDSAVKAPQSSEASYNVLETPIKKKTTVDLAHGHPIQSPLFDQENKKEIERPSLPASKMQGTSVGEEDSIYKSLGWENDDIDDLV